VLATTAGTFAPDGPLAAFPPVFVLQRAGADPGAAIAYATAWSVVGVRRFAGDELPAMGPEFAWLACLRRWRCRSSPASPP
jgi:hypothetical protein